MAIKGAYTAVQRTLSWVPCLETAVWAHGQSKFARTEVLYLQKALVLFKCARYCSLVMTEQNSGPMNHRICFTMQRSETKSFSLTCQKCHLVRQINIFTYLSNTFHVGIIVYTALAVLPTSSTDHTTNEQRRSYSGKISHPVLPNAVPAVACVANNCLVRQV